MKRQQLKALLIASATIQKEVRDNPEMSDTEILDKQNMWERLQLELNTLCWELVDRRVDSEEA